MNKIKNMNKQFNKISFNGFLVTFYSTMGIKNKIYDSYLNGNYYQKFRMFSNSTKYFSDIQSSNYLASFYSKEKLVDSDNFITKKNESIIFTFPFRMLQNKKYFTDTLIKQFEINNDYYILIKCKFGKEQYLMLGKQINLSFHDYNKEELLNKIDLIYQTIILGIESLMDQYSINDGLTHIQIIIKSYDKSILSDIKYDKEYLNFKEQPTEFKQDVVFFPLDINNLGRELKVEFNNTENNVSISKINNNFIDHDIIISNNDDTLYVLDNKTKFYYRDIYKSPFIVAIQDNEDHINKYAFSLLGILISKVKDIKEIKNIDEFTSNNSHSNDEISKDEVSNRLKPYSIKERISENLSIKLVDNNVVSNERKLKIKPIKRDIKLEGTTSSHEDNKIGVIDLETYIDNVTGKPKVYAAGVFTYMDEEPTLFYIDKDTYDSEKLVLNLINELCKGRYRDVTFYCHNFGNYDIYFILNTLLNKNSYTDQKTKKQGDTVVTSYKNYIFNINLVNRDNVFLKANIVRTQKGTKNRVSINICDSYPILSKSLHNLCKDFNVIENKKGIFPHEFANEKTLFYKGKTPDYSYYNNKYLKEDEYKSLFKKTWDFKKESLEYLKFDLLSLYEVITKFNHELFINFDLSITDSLTVSGLANKIFKKNYYKNNPYIPLINSKHIYNDIKESYYGGITEVYKPYGTNLRYYDVNSLYPFVALNPMPGSDVSYVTFFTKDQYSLKDLFGFFYCKIEAPVSSENSYLGLLPKREKSGLIFPLGSWEGWYFSEELKFASDNGYKITVVKGYKFNKVSGIFDNFIKDIYKHKQSNNKQLKSVSKLILNSLLGRFGLKLERTSLKIVNRKTQELINASRDIKVIHEFAKDKILIKYVDEIGMDHVKELDIDLNKLETKFKSPKEYKEPYADVSVAISSAITSYARIHITKIKLEILKLGGNIYYSDTDSIVTDIDLPIELVDSKDLGKLKLEWNILKEGYFISSKTYCLVLNDKDYNEDNKGLVKKCKGIDSNYLSLEDFINMYKNQSGVTVPTIKSVKDLVEGYVSLNKDFINISPLSYVKRTKIYNDNGLWIDTKPLILDKDLNTDKGIVNILDVKESNNSIKTVNVNVWDDPSESNDEFMIKFKEENCTQEEFLNNTIGEGEDKKIIEVNINNENNDKLTNQIPLIHTTLNDPKQKIRNKNKRLRGNKYKFHTLSKINYKDKAIYEKYFMLLNLEDIPFEKWSDKHWLDINIRISKDWVILSKRFNEPLDLILYNNLLSIILLSNEKYFIFYNTSSKDFIFYNTTTKDFILWGFLHTNSNLPIVYTLNYNKCNSLINIESLSVNLQLELYNTYFINELLEFLFLTNRILLNINKVIISVNEELMKFKLKSDNTQIINQLPDLDSKPLIQTLTNTKVISKDKWYKRYIIDGLLIILLVMFILSLSENDDTNNLDIFIPRDVEDIEPTILEDIDEDLNNIKESNSTPNVNRRTLWSWIDGSRIDESKIIEMTSDTDWDAIDNNFYLEPSQDKEILSESNKEGLSEENKEVIPLSTDSSMDVTEMFEIKDKSDNLREDTSSVNTEYTSSTILCQPFVKSPDPFNTEFSVVDLRDKINEKDSENMEIKYLLEEAQKEAREVQEIRSLLEEHERLEEFNKSREKFLLDHIEDIEKTKEMLAKETQSANALVDETLREKRALEEHLYRLLQENRIEESNKPDSVSNRPILDWLSEDELEQNTEQNKDFEVEIMSQSLNKVNTENERLKLRNSELENNLDELRKDWDQVVGELEELRRRKR